MKMKMIITIINLMMAIVISIIRLLVAAIFVGMAVMMTNSITRLMSPDGTKYTKNMYKLCIAGSFHPYLSPIRFACSNL